MKSYFIKYFLWEVWCVAGDYVLFGKLVAIGTIVFFLVMDLIGLIGYVVRKRKEVDIEASLNANFDIIPYKWFGIGALIAVIVKMHWEEYSVICVFLLSTLLLGYIFDTMDRHRELKKNKENANKG